MQLSVSRLGNHRRDRSPGIRQDCISWAVVRVAANTDRMSVVVRQDRLHRFDIQPSSLLPDQTANSVKPRKRIRQADVVIFRARVRSTKKMIRVSDETFTLIGDFSRSVGRQLDVKDGTVSVAENIVAARTNRVTLHQFSNGSKIRLLKNLTFERVVRKPHPPGRTAAKRVRKMSDTVLVQSVIAEHPAVRPHDRFREIVRTQMQHVSKVAHLIGHVAGLSDQHFAIGSHFRTEHKRRAGFG